MRPGRTRTGLALLVVGALAVCLVAVVVVWNSGRVGEATVTASSAAPGHPAAAAAVDGPGGDWRSADETVGSWIEMSWTRDRPVRQVTLVRPAGEPGATAGVLAFGDGSSVQVTLSGDRTVLPVAPRTVDRLRFTVSAVDPGSTGVGLDLLDAGSPAGTGGVRVGGTPDGNVASGGTVTASGTIPSGDTAALVDGTGDPGAGGTGADWTAPGPAPSVRLSWSRPRELTTVELTGAPGGASIARAVLTFGDGSVLPVGAVLPDRDRPTQVSFLPRVTTSVRLDVLDVTGPGAVTLAELRTYEVGATPPRAVPVGTPVPAVAPACVSADRPATGIAVRCPLPGTEVTDRVLADVVVAPGYTDVTAVAWPAEETAAAGPTVAAPVDASGAARLDVELDGVPPGPLTLYLEATGPGRAPAGLPITLRRVGATQPAPAGEPTAGRTLVWDEEFDGPLSVSRSGADTVYTGAKPVDDGEQDFGDAVLDTADTARVADGVLQIDVAPLPPGAADPQGWGRRHEGGLLASARAGGSGFSAQYGYFEARMLAPGLPGTWPAFWMLPADNLVAPTPVVAEIDAVELYGVEPQGSCHVVQEHGGDGGDSNCDQRFSSLRSAMAWHTYGVSVDPAGITFYIDGQAVHTADVVQGADAPMFFLVNLALGGGWPVELGPTGERAALYVDHVRVYV